MNNQDLSLIDEAVTRLLHPKSTKHLETVLVESAITIGRAQYGQLFCYDKDFLKKSYSSDLLLKKTAINKYITGKQYTTEKAIINIPESVFKKWRQAIIPKEIRSITLLPLFHNVMLGYIVLYRKTTTELTSLEKVMLSIYLKAAILAVNKNQVHKESKKALEIRDRFISLASHELRTPLTSLHGYIQLLHSRMTKQNADTIESRWVNELYVESIRLTTLVKELLDINRIKQGQFAFVFSEVPMLDVVTRAIEHYRITMSDHPIVFVNKTNNKQSHIVGDFDKLVEMVSGILSNAIKFSKPSEKITVSLKNSQNILTLVVKDTGKGISKKDLDDVFDGFYKSDQATHLEGMGLGLLLAKHIVENHRGKIKITSKENKGTKVEVTLPTIKTSPF